MPNKKITFIIPVRDEINNLHKTLTDYHNILNNGHQLILIDDISVDGSLKFMQDNYPNANIIEIDQKIDNEIIGKSNAIIEGYAHAIHSELCFLDADVYNLDISEIEKIVNKKTSKQVYTTIPKFVNQGLIENFSLFFQQILYLNFHFLNTNQELFGGFYLISDKLYKEVGMHKIIQDQIVEDLELAKEIVKVGEIKIFKSKSLKIHMYKSYRELYEGWSKNINYGLRNIKKINSLLLFSYIFIMILLIFNIFLDAHQILINYLIITTIFIFMENKYLESKYIYTFLWPLYLVNFILIFFGSIITKRKKWKGRIY